MCVFQIGRQIIKVLSIMGAYIILQIKCLAYNWKGLIYLCTHSRSGPMVLNFSGFCQSGDPCVYICGGSYPYSY